MGPRAVMRCCQAAVAGCCWRVRRRAGQGAVAGHCGVPVQGIVAGCCCRVLFQGAVVACCWGERRGASKGAVAGRCCRVALQALQ